VAHHREETRFGAACRFGRILGEAQRFIRGLALKLQRDPVKAAVKHRDHRVRVARFVDIIIGAAANRNLAVETGGHQHANQLPLFGAQTRDQINPARKAHVDQRDRGRCTAVGRLAQRRERPLGGVGAARRIALPPQHLGERSGKAEIVINDHHRTYGSVLLTHRLPRMPVPTLPGRAVGSHSCEEASIRVYSEKLYTHKLLNRRSCPACDNRASGADARHA